MTKKQEKAEAARQAWEMLKDFRGRPIMAQVNSVSRSGMSRRIEFYSTTPDGQFQRIGYWMAKVLDYPYSVDKGGIQVGGCGMDMRFHVVSNFNYRACALDNPTLTWEERREKFGRIYDTYFFDANRIQS